MDIKIDLEKSDYIKLRNELMKNLEIPRLSEAKSTLGDSLSKIVFDECDEALKEAFGLQPPLKGALGDLWVSPSSLLIGKIALTPPHTRKHIQALTHEGIMNIGTGIEKKFMNEMNMDKETALATQQKNLLHSFGDSIKAEIKDVEARERAACQREIERLTQEFELHLEEELGALQSRLRHEHETSAESQEKVLERKWEDKLKGEVRKTIAKLTEQFLNELERQEDVMKRHFKVELKKKEIQKEYDLGTQRVKYHTNVEQLRHVLECKNIANMMYILCMERRKCCKEKEDIEKYYKQKLEELENVISQKDVEHCELNHTMKQHRKEVQLRETCILEIIRQFQKFINFALRSAPTQAEFLLSIEKMMVFELTDALLKSAVDTLEPCGETLSWMTPKKYLESTDTIPGLEVDDGHNCFRELPPIPKEGEDQFLPAFHYKNKLYVREDFRNMLSQGIGMAQSNELWTPEVQILIDTLEKSMKDTRLSEDLMSQKTLKIPQADSEVKSSRAHSTIHFSLGWKNQVPVAKLSTREPKDEDMASINKRKQMSMERSSLRITTNSVAPIDFSSIGKEENKPFLLAAKSSLELIINKGSVRYLGRKGMDDIKEDSISTGTSRYDSVSPPPTFERNSHDIRKKSQFSTNGSFDLADRIWKQNSFEFTDIEVPSDDKNTDLVLDARDSIMLRQVSLIKDQTDFRVSPKDSIKVLKGSASTLRKKSSKLVTARDSVELLRTSRSLLKEPFYLNRKKDSKYEKDDYKSRSVSWTSIRDICSEKCAARAKESAPMNGCFMQRKTKDDFSYSNVKMAQVEVISIDRDHNHTTVSFQRLPVVHETESDMYSKQLAQLYQEPAKTQRQKQRPNKDKFISLPKTIRVVGETQGQEYRQNEDVFTADRIHSLISMIKDHPNLIKTFTACRR
ncbi:hypothetical protein JTB14_011787 [Gonioctena quinquepunctata]|nr:hypothetical protein JTB14_011787 [Gonioctena quinquepunctata]KAG5877084.1 hypothetical protein JTB14_011787 [Gonioctena quinquepunctata]